MAKKKHHKKRRHHAVGALNPKSPLVMLASVGIGYLMADTINGKIDQFNTTTTTPAGGGTPVSTNTVSPTIVMVGELGIGGLLLLSKRKGGTMGMVKTVAGGVLAGAGLKRALKKFGVVSGYQSVPVIGRRMGGYQAVPVIGGMRPGQLAGAPGPGQLQGYRVNGMNNGYVPNGSGTSKIMGSVDPASACAAGCL